ncbi:transposase family protein [Actinospica sp.]|uniref:transposase family protein n=1 Tax=Actinospica sp. TaxID=1872142 RepID=UPI0039C8B214
MDPGHSRCPSRGYNSSAVHSGYERSIADTAVGGRRLVIELTVRRFFCRDPACPKKTFVEQVPGLTSRYGRDTLGLRRIVPGQARSDGRLIRGSRVRGARTSAPTRPVQHAGLRESAQVASLRDGCESDLWDWEDPGRTPRETRQQTAEMRRDLR